MFINPAFAQEAVNAAAGAAVAPDAPIRLLVQFGVIFAVFYFFLIRPQQKKFKEHQAMQDSVVRGDTIITSGGIIGKVVRSSERELDVEIAEGVCVKVIREKILLKKIDDKNTDGKTENNVPVQDNGPEKSKDSEGLKDVLTKK